MEVEDKNSKALKILQEYANTKVDKTSRASFRDNEGNLAFRRLYLTEDKIPSELETMMLKDFSGTIEFGTQNASKTAMSLFGSNITGDESVLLRVPYKSELPPVIAFLHCDKKLNL